MTTTTTATTAAPAAGMPFGQPADLGWYDVILVNSSAGKDSQAMLDLVAQGARLDQLVVAHADLGRVEWPGTRELAQAQAKHYHARFEVVQRGQDLLDQVEERGMWPGPSTRYCTSDHKRDQIAKLMTKLADERHLGKGKASRLGRPVRILNCLGLRAQESDGRRDCPKCERKPARMAACTRCLGTGDHPTFERDTRASNGRREVHTWLPIHAWTVDQVWARIKASGVPHHPAYDQGMKRLSCMFCVFAPAHALKIAGRANPALLDAYCGVEARIGHSFTSTLSIRSIRLQLVQEAAQEAAGPAQAA